MKVVDYRILEFTTKIELGKQVRTLLEYNWQPIGGISSVNLVTTRTWLQAMVKYE